MTHSVSITQAELPQARRPATPAPAWEEARRRSIIWARRYARQPEEAEDIAQEALLRAWRHRATLRKSEGFYPWLATIVRNEAARRYRRPELEVASSAEIEAAVADDEVVDLAARADVQVGLRRLRPLDRALLALRYEADLTQSAIAERLGVPEGTVKVRLHRARAKLRDELE